MRKILLIMVSLAFLGCDEKEGGIPVVGVNDFGVEIEKVLDPDEFHDQLLEVIESTSRVGVLVAESAPNESDWSLESITIGVGIQINLGIFHFVDLGSSGRFRFAFSKDPVPAIPRGVQ